MAASCYTLPFAWLASWSMSEAILPMHTRHGQLQHLPSLYRAIDSTSRRAMHNDNCDCIALHEQCGQCKDEHQSVSKSIVGRDANESLHDGVGHILAIDTVRAMLSHQRAHCALYKCDGDDQMFWRIDRERGESNCVAVDLQNIEVATRII